MAELGSCRFKMGEAAPVCGQPAVSEVELSLPAEVIEGVKIAEDQRRQRLAVCAEHKALIDSLVAPGVFSMTTPAEARSSAPIEPGHKTHRAYVPGCLGCAYDFEPPW